MMGIASIENAVEPMEEELPENEIKPMAIILKESMGKVVASYEREKEINLEKQIEEKLLPAFKNWREGLEKILRPYVVS